MKRTALSRKTPLARTGGPQRKTRLSPKRATPRRSARVEAPYYWPRDPHPERVAAARLANDQRRRSESAWLELAEIWRGVSEADQRALLAVVKLRQALPVGIDGLVRVFEAGAVKHNGGQLGIAPGVTAPDCAEHMLAHAERADVDAASRDPETGEFDASHASARGVMVAQLVDSVQRGEVW